MTDVSGPGQADKRAADMRTAQVGAESRTAQQRGAQPGQSQPGQADQQGEQPQVRTAAERVGQWEAPKPADVVAAGEPDVLVNPYPDYGGMSLNELRSLAQSRDVEINRDVEKAQLVAHLRAKDPHPQYDFLPLEQLRERADVEGVKLDEEFEAAHLIGELRAADTHTR
jgi:hypothetical protein